MDRGKPKRFILYGLQRLEVDEVKKLVPSDRKRSFRRTLRTINRKRVIGKGQQMGRCRLPTPSCQQVCGIAIRWRPRRIPELPPNLMLVDPSVAEPAPINILLGAGVFADYVGSFCVLRRKRRVKYRKAKVITTEVLSNFAGSTKERQGCFGRPRIPGYGLQNSRCRANKDVWGGVLMIMKLTIEEG